MENRRVGDPIDHARLASAVAAGRFEWRAHVLMRLAERDIRQDVVLNIVCDGECIEDYPEDFPYPSALFFGITEEGAPLHIVAAYDLKNDWAYIITAYVPNSTHFESDWKTRRKNE